MKKLLSVLLVVTLSSFLLVGCDILTPAEGEGEGEGEVEVSMNIEDEYTNAGGVAFVGCAKDVTVTFPTPVAVDHVVYIARKIVEGDGTVIYKLMPDTEPVAATPNADRTVWTVEDYEFLYGYPCEEFRAKQPNGFECECEPICLVALVKHPCCPGEEVVLRVVTVDCTPPKIDLFPVPGAYMEWTNKTSYACDTFVYCCEDDCSGEGPWSLVADPDPCLGPCATASGEGCPVEGVIECGCFDYAPDTSEDICYYVDFIFEDNVGNARESTWKLCFDTDSLVSFEVDDNPGEVFSVDRTLSGLGGRYAVYNDCE
jgi:hypothetical protein